jgi:hypothetical protein
MKVYRLIILFFFSVTSLSAQVNVNMGAQASYMNTFSAVNKSVGHLGFGLRGEVGLMDVAAIQAGFHYFFPGGYNHLVEATAYSSNTTPQVIPIESKSSISCMDFYIGAKYYMQGSHSTVKKESGTGFYVAADVGIITAGGETISDLTVVTNLNNYKVPIADKQASAFSFLTLSPSIGVERMFGPVYAYAELRGSVKLYETSSAGLKYDIPFVANFNVGFRVRFGSDY